MPQLANIQYRAFFRCYSLPFFVSSNGNVLENESGGKIYLPQRALEALLQRRVTYPMLFSMQGKAPQGNGKVVHCGVLEFTAEEGKCYAPSWMLRQLGIDEGGLVEVANVTLPLGTYVKVQPHSRAFIDTISNHRAVLEHALKNYAALTVGDNIVFSYNKRDYVLSVNEVRPDAAASGHAISVVETNIQIDFDPPKDTSAGNDVRYREKKFREKGRWQRRLLRAWLPPEPHVLRPRRRCVRGKAPSVEGRRRRR